MDQSEINDSCRDGDPSCCEPIRLRETAVHSDWSNQKLTTVVVMGTPLWLEKLMCLTTAAMMSQGPNRVGITVTDVSDISVIGCKNPGVLILIGS